MLISMCRFATAASALNGSGDHKWGQMNEYVVLVAEFIGGVLGGALGASLAKIPFWKGAFLAAVASIIQFIMGQVFTIEQPVVYSLIYLCAVGLIGGRWGMRLTARQLGQIVIGSFLLGLLAGAAVIYLTTWVSSV